MNEGQDLYYLRVTWYALSPSFRDFLLGMSKLLSFSILVSIKNGQLHKLRVMVESSRIF